MFVGISQTGQYTTLPGESRVLWSGSPGKRRALGVGLITPAI
jgi:hypothetical protein